MKTTDLNVIRVETALSRFPMHRLSKRGRAVEIAILEENAAGDLLRWEVSYNTKYGQPGPLAYKLDSLVISRRVEEVGRPTPKLIRLGSLNDICRQLGLVDSGKNKADIKRALFQNASAFITARIRYKPINGAKRSIEIGDTRYAVIFTGEKLPDGTEADGVHLVLHDAYREILDTAITRPLDYDYLRTLAPTPQRLYELLSYQIYAALKNGHPTATLSYGEFCRYAPQTRYFIYDKVKKQLYNLHKSHKSAGYISGVTFSPTTDREGKADWIMIYIPGPKAREEFEAFAQRGRASSGGRPSRDGGRKNLAGKNMGGGDSLPLFEQIKDQT